MTKTKLMVIFPVFAEHWQIGVSENDIRSKPRTTLTIMSQELQHQFRFLNELLTMIFEVHTEYYFLYVRLD